MVWESMDKVLKYLEANQPRFIEDLCSYLRFPSVSAQPQHAADINACADWLVTHCRSIGLEAELHATSGCPVVMARNFRARTRGRPHYLIYGHYDVQPAEPFELWKTPPFEPRLQGRSLFARGSTDNKGQNFAHLKAIEAYLKTGTEMPCDLTVVLEGEEEIGSASLAPFLKEHRKKLLCDAIVISDTGMPDKKHPALTYSLRGVLAIEVKLWGHHAICIRVSMAVPWTIRRWFSASCWPS